MKKLGVIVARFQVPYLHDGHKQLISQSAKNSDMLVILLGHKIHQPDIKNPFSFAIRKKMIEEELSEQNLKCSFVVDGIEDHPISNELWSLELDSIIKKHENSLDDGSGVEVYLYGSRDSFIKSYYGNYKTVLVNDEIKVSGTEIRNRILNLPETYLTKEHREGIMYALKYVYPVGMSVVDVVVYKKVKGEFFVLLGRKPRENVFRIIGGFFDVEHDNSLEDAARRELQEEVGNITVGNPVYLMSKKVDDWRYRDNQHKIVSSLFAVEYISGEPVAGDDIQEVKWFSIKDYKHVDVTKDHLEFIEKTILYLQKR